MSFMQGKKGTAREYVSVAAVYDLVEGLKTFTAQVMRLLFETLAT